MFIGEFQHSVDAKGRVNFPAKLRENMGERFYLTKGMDGCLAVYPTEEWELKMQQFRGKESKEVRALERYFSSSTVEVEPDKQGRILIPANLRSFAEIEKDVMIIGAGVRAEIWDKLKWEESQTLTDDDVVKMMEKLSL